MTLSKASLYTMALATLTSLAAHAVDPTEVPAQKRTKLGLYLTATEAHDVAQRERVLFVDTRTRAEDAFLGLPTTVDANIPYMEVDAFYRWDDKKATFKLEPNADFVAAIDARLASKGLDRYAKVILLCRSGDRSAKATDLLAQHGFGNVWSVIDGYEGDMAKDGSNAGRRAVNGWKNAQLPWTYKLAKDKMYLPQ